MKPSGVFHLVKCDEGARQKGPEDIWRLVCVLKDGGNIAIWGRDDAMENTSSWPSRKTSDNATRQVYTTQTEVDVLCAFR